MIFFLCFFGNFSLNIFSMTFSCDVFCGFFHVTLLPATLCPYRSLRVQKNVTFTHENMYSIKIAQSDHVLFSCILARKYQRRYLLSDKHTHGDISVKKTYRPIIKCSKMNFDEILRCVFNVMARSLSSGRHQILP